MKRLIKIPKDWPRGYLGIPHTKGGRTTDGLDCYGLIVVVYADLLGISLDAREHEHWGRGKDRVAASFAAGPGGGYRIIEAHQPHILKPLDTLILSLGGRPLHCGINVNGREFLHVSGDSVVLARLFDPKWQLRLRRIYRPAGVTLITI